MDAPLQIDILPAPSPERLRARIRRRLPAGRTFATVGVIVVAIGVLSSGAAFAVDRTGSARLLPGTTIQGVDVGGRRVDDAVRDLEAALEDPLHLPLRVTAPGFDRLTTPWDLGLRVDVSAAARKALDAGRDGNVLRRLWRRFAGGRTALSAAPTWRRSELQSFVKATADRLWVEPMDAELDFADGWLHVTPGRVGRRLDTDAAAHGLASAARRGDASFSLPVRDMQPAVPTSAYAAVVLVRAGENKLYLYENGVITHTYPVASGSPAFATPLGQFKIVNKRKNPKWINPGSDWAKRMPDSIPPGPDNPLGSRAMDLDVSGIRIHGTRDAGSIGFSVSHGCVRMHLPDAEDLFERVAVGTPVVILQAAPPA